MTKYTILDAIKYARINGGECLTTGIEIINSNTPITYKCGKGHIWTTEFRISTGKKSWCKKCVDMENRKYDIDFACSIAIKKGGMCLSKEYRNVKDKLMWKCGVCNFVWESSLKSINRGTWCPNCANNLRKKCKLLRCLNCNIEILTRNDYFCSTECKNDFNYNEFIRKWKDGEYAGLSGESISNYIKRYLFQTRGKKCEECGWDKVNIFTNNVPVVVHHIDGDWKNNKEENLKVLCPNCHSLTGNYGSLNNGNGRKKRKEKREINRE